MKKSTKIYNILSAGLLGLMILFSANLVFAQRFGHGGGGGGHVGGGGGFGGGRPSTPAFHNFNRGGGGERHDMDHGRHWEEQRRPVFQERGIRHNENVYHPVYEHRPYYYHAYRPYGWGRYWHPFGYFLGGLTADAFYFTWANQAYYYDWGVFYVPSGSGYVAVAPPLNAVVNYLPDGYTTVMVGDDTYYYYGGVFYVYTGSGYQVVQAPIGAIVYQLPDGAVEQIVNGQNYMVFNNTYYLPISQNGADAYEVVQP